ncbi:thioesterase family protein [Virgibacillus sp. 179-BFC.A HS]|uniref:Thioesterase family protein n=1 Tax=Tigheibacillus jepli TaxID=3035914 RepID=A0ABU5CHK7_9BACI|nr:thioesterase family protein [Virgibacillus sp. 179-BFC.A HS]MDY0405781.1 thioesterase family protein [Virgibacillus sp. 179-BFC.A HS]
MKKVLTEIEVRYQETDQMGVVYHANYLVWFEIGRTKFVESLGLEYAGMEKDNVVSPVTDVNISYKKPIHYGEKATVETWLEKYNGVRTVYGYEIKNEQGQIAVLGTTQHVIVEKNSFRPLSLRKTFPKWHQAYMQAIEENA